MRHVRGFVDGEYQDGEVRGLSFLAGTRGFGKTTEMARLLSQCRGRVVFFDTLSKHDFPGYVIVREPGEMKDAFRRHKFPRVMYQPRAGILDEHFRAACAIVYAVGQVIFAVDEIDKHCGTRWGETRMCPELYDLVNYGRHHRVSMIATARRPANVPRGYTSECGEMRLFHFHENLDVRYFAEFVGAEVAERLRTLPKYQYLLWHNDGSEPHLCGGKKF